MLGRTHGPPATKNAGGSTTGSARTTGIPCAMVLRFIRDLPGVPGLLAPVASRNRPQDLTPASGRQDHTISPSANRVARLATPQRPSHPDPNVRGDARTPLCAGQDARIEASDLPDGASGIFAARGVRRWSGLKRQKKLVFWRRDNARPSFVAILRSAYCFDGHRDCSGVTGLKMLP